ncbi:MAG: flagellin FliC [Nitrospinae bacterium]|nr:flagellin FliC [Nitrospinota bacterium]
MPIRIFNNIPSLTTQRLLGTNNEELGQSFSRVASGTRITKSADDAAGLAISEALFSDTRALKQGGKNLGDGMSMVKTAEGALNEQAGILLRLRELASQAATGTIGQNERDTIQLEFDSLRKELDRIANTTEFNGQKLLDGSLAATALNNVHIQIGLNSGQDNRISINAEADLTASSSSGLGIASASVDTQTNALSAMTNLTDAVRTLSVKRAKVGALQNRFEKALSNINVSVENLMAAQAGIKDADMAEEFARLTRSEILVQSAAAMVGQSNLIPQGVLQLLR